MPSKYLNVVKNEKRFKVGNVIKFNKKEVSGMYPFGRDVKKQKIAGVVLIVIGIILTGTNAPFVVSIGSLRFLSTTIGVILFILGIVYILDTQL